MGASQTPWMWQVRPEDAPRLCYPLGQGDLLVMKGTMQQVLADTMPAVGWV